jgi:transketolase
MIQKSQKGLLKDIKARMWSKLGQRGTYGTALMDIGEKIENVLALTGDLSTTSGLDRFQVRFPKRFFNVGIAEQNMLGIAAGLASENYIPFVSTFATFASMRCMEQVRVNMGYMNLNVKLVGLASGFAMGHFGSTHYGTEDISMVRTIPNIVVLSPADCTETAKAIEAMAMYQGPVYLRLTGVMSNPIIYKEDFDYTIGKAIRLREGKDISIIATGSMVYHALEAAKLLEEKSVSASVIDMHTLKPLDTEVIDMSSKSQMIVTIEEHSIIGGLGGAVAEYLSSTQLPVKQLFIGVQDCILPPGDYQFMLKQHGLTAPQIADTIFNNLERK